MERDFYKYIIDNEEKDVLLVVYNIITKERRVVSIFLNRKWPGADFLLGFRVRYESIDVASKNIFRVTRVINE